METTMYLLCKTEAMGLDYSVICKGTKDYVHKMFRKRYSHARNLGWREVTWNLDKNGDMFFYYKRGGKTVILALVEDKDRAKFLAPDSFKDKPKQLRTIRT